MITVFALLILLGCAKKDDRLRTDYLMALETDASAYVGADAALAYREKAKFIEYVKKLEREGASIPYKDIYVWEYARLGLLAEHLGRKEDAARFFAIADENAKKAYPTDERMNSAAALRTALEQMDTPEKVGWRKKPKEPSIRFEVRQ